MPDYALSEVYFVAAMMVLILIISFVAVYFFFKTFQKEKREKLARAELKAKDVDAASRLEKNG